jgi:hypothetical protein
MQLLPMRACRANALLTLIRFAECHFTSLAFHVGIAGTFAWVLLCQHSCSGVSSYHQVKHLQRCLPSRGPHRLIQLVKAYSC